MKGLRSCTLMMALVLLCCIAPISIFAQDKQVQGEPSEQVQQSTVEKININTATKADLEKLPGIGPTIAERIINYREQNGPFKAIEEIKNVQGIGDKKFEAMKDLISVE